MSIGNNFELRLEATDSNRNISSNDPQAEHRSRCYPQSLPPDYFDLQHPPRGSRRSEVCVSSTIGMEDCKNVFFKNYSIAGSPMARWQPLIAYWMPLSRSLRDEGPEMAAGADVEHFVDRGGCCKDRFAKIVPGKDFESVAGFQDGHDAF